MAHARLIRRQVPKEARPQAGLLHFRRQPSATAQFAASSADNEVSVAVRLHRFSFDSEHWLSARPKPAFHCRFSGSSDRQ